MISSKHTPGPWSVETLPSGKRLIADLVDGPRKGGTVLHHYRIVHDGREEMDGEADAALIAAAPELLAACKGLLAELPDLWGDEVQDGGLDLMVSEDAVYNALEAIAKARGES